MSGAADGSIMAAILTTHAPMKPAARARSGPVDIVFIAMLLGEAVWARNAIQAATVTAASDTPMRTVALSAGKRTLFRAYGLGLNSPPFRTPRRLPLPPRRPRRRADAPAPHPHAHA